jgi:RNA polymerase sigma-70 factor (sigma-E family)
MRGSGSGRDAEFEAFATAAMPELFRIAWFLTGDMHRAKDLVQDSLIGTFLAWPRVRSGGAMAYTRRVMTNRRIDGWRKNRREVLVEAPVANHVGNGDEVDRATTAAGLVAALRRLPEQQRRVVVLRYYCDLSERTVAAELGISVGAVKSAASRGLTALRGHARDFDMEEWLK